MTESFLVRQIKYFFGSLTKKVVITLTRGQSRSKIQKKGSEDGKLKLNGLHIFEF